jgi:hypothetical protein
MNATTTTLFTGRDILAAENHLRQGTEAAALRIVAQMPAEVVARLAVHVGADASDLAAVVRRARLSRAAR